MTKISLAVLGLAALIAAPSVAFASDVDGRFQDANSTATVGVYQPGKAARIQTQGGNADDQGFMPDSAGSSQGHGARAPGELR